VLIAATGGSGDSRLKPGYPSVIRKRVATANRSSTPHRADANRSNRPAAELTKVWLRPHSSEGRAEPGRWAMTGEGPGWVNFGGGVEGLRFKAGGQFAVECVHDVIEPHARSQLPSLLHD
jgi:hypothetical protein